MRHIPAMRAPAICLTGPRELPIRVRSPSGLQVLSAIYRNRGTLEGRTDFCKTGRSVRSVDLLFATLAWTTCL